MKLKSFNYLIRLINYFFYSPVLSEEKIDIWKNKKEKNHIRSSQLKKKKKIL